GGLSIRTTLDPKFQVMARKALTDGLVRFDEAQGWRGPLAKIDVSGDWGAKLAEIKSLADIAPWRLAVVLETSDQAAPIGFQPPPDPSGTCARARQWLYALDRGAGRPHRDRSGARHGRVASGELRGQVLWSADAAVRARAFPQRDDGKARPGRRHAADRGIRQTLRRL